MFKIMLKHIQSDLNIRPNWPLIRYRIMTVGMMGFLVLGMMVLIGFLAAVMNPVTPLGALSFILICVASGIPFAYIISLIIRSAVDYEYKKGWF